MLVLGRQELEDTVLVLPDGTIITATICSIRGDKVRTGWTAPPEVRIYRREVYEAIKRDGPIRPATTPEAKEQT